MNHNNQQPGSVDLLDKIEAIIDSTTIFRHSAEGKAVGSLLKQVRDAIAASRRTAGGEDFAVWLAREMPAGTVIADPAWWAPRILRAVGRSSLPDVAMPEQHTDDIAVDRFAAAMKEKMAKSRAKGRGGWDDPAQCSIHTLQAMLIDHLAKGDPVDAGNFAMMLFIRDGRTCAVPEGFALVPTMYTNAMRKAWDSGPLTDDDDSDFARGYAAMVAAAPKPGEMPQYVTCGAAMGRVITPLAALTFAKTATALAKWKQPQRNGHEQ